MSKNAYLLLENGEIMKGRYFGAQGTIVGEVVFNTTMIGYLETLTDPAYEGKIILQTFPLMGNYGVISEDFESAKITPRAYIVKYDCKNPSNFRNEGNLDDLFKAQGVIGISGIDTRKLTKIIRDNGTMNAKIMDSEPTPADIAEIKSYKIEAAVTKVSKASGEVVGNGDLTVALIDLGAQKSVTNYLTERDCKVHHFAADADFDEIIAIKPNGIMLSGGPGDPNDPANAKIIETIKKLQAAKIPIFGICLGHLLLAVANDYKIEKMKFGHRGANLPVKDLKTEKIYITTQNHGHIAIADDAWFVNVNDKTCEGIKHSEDVFGVQFRPTAGTPNTEFLYDEFVERMKKNAVR